MNQTADALPGKRSPARPPSFEQQLVGAARYVENLPRGPRAVLRRLNPDPNAVPPEPFWHIVDRYGIRPDAEPFWLAVLPLMVQHRHDPGLAPGVALARSGVSAARLEKWLRLDVEDARREAGRLLARVENGFNWVEFGRLLHRWGEAERRSLARQFFLSPEYRALTATSAGAE